MPSALTGHDDVVSSAAFSPDGQKIVTGSSDKTIRIWNADGSGAPRVFEGHTGSALVGAEGGRGAWNPDGRQIVTFSSDKTLRVWNANGTDEPAVLRIPEVEHNVVGFSLDGTRIFTGSYSAPDPSSGKKKYGIMLWPRIQPITGPDDPALWTATRYCPHVELRMEMLAVAAEEAERQWTRCQCRVAAAFEKAGMSH